MKCNVTYYFTVHIVYKRYANNQSEHGCGPADAAHDLVSPWLAAMPHGYVTSHTQGTRIQRTPALSALGSVSYRCVSADL